MRFLIIILLSLLPLLLGQVRVDDVRPKENNFREKIQKFPAGEKGCSLLEQRNRRGRCELLTALAVENILVSSGDTANVIVHGAINGEETFGVTILVEIVPREGAVGDVWFTLSPPSDISQVGDPWVDRGLFSSYDTDLVFNDCLNATVDDDGNYLPVPVWYSGPLSMFPVQTSFDAVGIWDVHLSTSVGDSDWEGVSTVLLSGTIEVK